MATRSSQVTVKLMEFAGICRNSFSISYCDMRFEQQTERLEDSLTKFRRLTLLGRQLQILEVLLREE
jgi:hypothetical protein